MLWRIRDFVVEDLDAAMRLDANRQNNLNCRGLLVPPRRQGGHCCDERRAVRQAANPKLLVVHRHRIGSRATHREPRLPTGTS
jgi:hypothetical protein